jgi:hypothetical protein
MGHDLVMYHSTQIHKRTKKIPARKVADPNSQAGLQIFFNSTLNISQLNMKIKRDVSN